MGSEIAKKRLMRDSLTMRQQEEQERKNILANEQRYYQSVTNDIAYWKESLKFRVDLEKKRPNNEDYKYRRMERELELAKDQAVLEAYRPLWVHLGILPEDEVHKKDETLNNGACFKWGRKRTTMQNGGSRQSGTGGLKSSKHGRPRRKR